MPSGFERHDPNRLIRSLPSLPGSLANGCTRMSGSFILLMACHYAPKARLTSLTSCWCLLVVHASPRCPGFRDSAARGSFSTCRRPMVRGYLIYMMAELDLPTAYPAPACNVTITLYAC